MKNLFFFFAIIALGLLGLVIADQIDFKNGRVFSKQNSIGNGVSDPMVAELQEQKLQSSATELSPSKVQKKLPSTNSESNASLDGIQAQKR